jgi:hypothetical protein
MEIGSIRERILISLLMYKFGPANVETEIPITEAEIDVKLFGEPISIKTITGSTSGIKVIWTVDAQKAKEFRERYIPSCDILLTYIKWEGKGGLFHIPLKTQLKIFDRIGEKYLKLPKEGTNPRGVEFSKDAMNYLFNEASTNAIEIQWKRRKLKYNPYQRWLNYWKD